MKIEDISIINFVDGLVNEKGEPINFTEHFYLYDIYRDLSPLQVYKKAAQVGLSTAKAIKVFFVAKTRGLSTIYTLPSDEDVYEFVPSKVDKIYQSNPKIVNFLQTDNVERKQVNDRFIFFKGTRSKTAPIMTTSDLLVHDEVDRSDQTIIEQYESRTSRSKYRGIWSLSNPSTTDNGVDRIWKMSDKKEWFITCTGCNTEQTLKWEENVSYNLKQFICSKCGKPFSNRERILGKWVKTGEGKWSGYHISQLMCPWVSAEDLITQRETKGLEYFNNFVLGEPYDVADIKIRPELVTDIWTPKDLNDSQYFLGVDVGKIKHYVLGTKYGITEVGTTENWQDIEFLINKYNPIAVIDALPDITPAQELKNKYPRVFLSYYRRDRNKAEMYEWGDKENTGLVYSDRNRVIDQVIDDMTTAKFQISIPGEMVKKYVAHWLTLRRIKEQDSLGVDRYVWESSSGVDHFVHATVYWWLASRRGGGTAFEPRKEDKVKQELIIETSDGPQIMSLEDYLEEQRQLNYL